MNFGDAIKAMRDGKRVQRSGWNGKNQYIELASRISYMNAKGEVVNVDHDAIGNKAVAFVGTSGVQIGWLASQADMLADDWKLVDSKEEVKMKLYVGAKVIKAEPAKATKDYGDHKVGDDGYRVIYPDGYESWSPKDVFEAAYREVPMDFIKD